MSVYAKEVQEAEGQLYHAVQITFGSYIVKENGEFYDYDSGDETSLCKECAQLFDKVWAEFMKSPEVKDAPTQ